ncbi:MAG: CPBP family glutamic-type intramembrane protease [Planctomycetota bacterium]
MNDSADSVDWRSKACCIAPLLVFFLLPMLISTESEVGEASIDAGAYLVLVAARVVCMTLVVVYFLRQVLSTFPFAVDGRSVAVGLVGAVIWIGLCHLQLERSVLDLVGLSEQILPERDAVDPFAIYSSDGALYGFLLVRFALLVVCVPVAEELFLRGFMMRAVEAENWPQLPLSEIGRTGLIVGTVYGVLSHPGELIAAAIWFSLVTWLMVRTGRFWNCVVAHAVTNLVLGVYVCAFGQWQLW